MVAQATCCGFWASRQLAQARGISLKRDPALPTHLFLCPRLGGGGGSPEQDPSARANCWASLCCIWMSTSPWMICFGWVWLYDDWPVYNGAWSIFLGMIHELWMNGLVWDLACEMNVRFEIKGTWYWHEMRH